MRKGTISLKKEEYCIERGPYGEYSFNFIEEGLLKTISPKSFFA